MSKYSRFEDFMVAVVKTSDATCLQRYGQSLNDLYKVKSSTLVAAIFALIDKGWGVFLAVTALLLLGPIAFPAALAAFGLNPIGLIAVSILAAFGGITMIRTMYQNKKLPLAIRETGNKYKPIFKSYQNYSENQLIEKVNILEKDASSYLISKAMQD